MQHYYIPCTQQERLLGLNKRSGTSKALFRRCSSSRQGQVVDSEQKFGQSSQWATSHSDSLSQTPSLEDSSSPSQQDETSPRTPNSFVSDDSCAIEQDRSQKASSQSQEQITTQYSGYSFINGDALPSRPKTCDQNEASLSEIDHDIQSRLPKGGAPAVITETAVRSRVARPSTSLNLGLPAATHGPVKKAAPVVTFNSRCHARRRPGGQSTAAAPPKLKRDTDCTDAIVKLIVCFSTKLVHAIWTESTTTPRSSGAFQGAGVLPLRVFIQETLRRSKTSYSTLQVALFYLILLKPYVGQHHNDQDGRTSSCRALQCGRRMFLTALILASKYLQDRNYSSRAWSKISGLPINEINENERRYLNLIQFNLHMKKESFENWSKIVLTLCKAGEASMNRDLAQESSKSHHVDPIDNVNIARDDEARSGSDQWWMQQLGLLSSDMIESCQKTEAYLTALTDNKLVSNIESERLLPSLDTPPSSPDSASDIVCEKGVNKPSPEISMDFGGQKFVDFGSSPAPSVSIPTRPRLPNLPTPQTTPRFTRTLPMPKGMCQMRSRCRESARVLTGLERNSINAANLETCPPPQPKVRAQNESCVPREASGLANNYYVSGFASSPESIISDAASSAPRSRSSSMSSNSSTWWSSATQQGLDENCGRAQGLRRELSLASTARQPLETTIPSSYSFYHGTQPVSKISGDEQIPYEMSDHGLTSTMAAATTSDGSCGSADGDIDSILASMTDRHVSPIALCPAVALSSSEKMCTEQSVRRHKRDRSSISEDILQYRVRNLLWDESSSVDVIDSIESIQSSDKQLQYPVKGWACLKRPVSNGIHAKRFAMCHDGEPYSTDLASRYLRDDITMVN